MSWTHRAAAVSKKKKKKTHALELKHIELLDVFFLMMLSQFIVPSPSIRVNCFLLPLLTHRILGFIVCNSLCRLLAAYFCFRSSFKERESE
jgi:hypothetical protein